MVFTVFAQGGTSPIHTPHHTVLTLTTHHSLAREGSTLTICVTACMFLCVGVCVCVGVCLGACHRLSVKRANTTTDAA